MTQFPTYHDPFTANIPHVVAAIEEQCDMPFEEAVEKYGGRPILCDDGSYVSIADPPGCGPEHFAAKAEAYRLLFERQDRARTVTDARAALRLEAAPVKPARKPRRPSISKMIEDADKAGKPLASITMPDGTKLDFGRPESVEPENPWPLDEFRTKENKQ